MLLARVRDTVAEAIANQNLPFDKLQEAVRGEHQQDGGALARVAFSFATPLATN